MKPVVDAIIPVYSKIPLLMRCLNSLKDQVRLGKVVIIDDASPDADRDVLNTLKSDVVSVYRNDGNSGFIKSVNRGVKKTDAPYILILNSDTEAIHNHCIERMAENLDAGAAICGALLIYPKDDLSTILVNLLRIEIILAKPSKPKFILPVMIMD